MLKIKLERFPDGDDDTYIAYGYDQDGRPLVLQQRRSDVKYDHEYPEYIWIQMDF